MSRVDPEGDNHSECHTPLVVPDEQRRAFPHVPSVEIVDDVLTIVPGLDLDPTSRGRTSAASSVATTEGTLQGQFGYERNGLISESSNFTAGVPWDHVHPSEETGVIAECMRHNAVDTVSFASPMFGTLATDSVEETKMEIEDPDESYVSPLPTNFASAYTGTDTASILEGPNDLGDAALACALAAQDEDLLAMKRAAAFGEDNTQASVVEITEEFHPSELQGGVQAEFVGPGICLPSPQPFASTAPSTSTSSTATMVVDDDNAVEEAVVIDSEPVHKSAQATREAQVLPVLDESSASDATSKPSSTDSRDRQHSSHRRSQRRRWAEVTEIQELPDLHPLERDEMRPDTGAEAQLVGADDSYAVAVPQLGSNTTYETTPHAPRANAVVVDPSGTTEHESTIARAIAQAPQEESTDTNLGFAEVMMEDPNVLDQTFDDRKPSARPRPNRRHSEVASLAIIEETDIEVSQEMNDRNSLRLIGASGVEGSANTPVVDLIVPSFQSSVTVTEEDSSQQIYPRHSQAEVVDIRETCDIHPAEEGEQAQSRAEYFRPETVLVPPGRDTLEYETRTERGSSTLSVVEISDLYNQTSQPASILNVELESPATADSCHGQSIDRANQVATGEFVPVPILGRGTAAITQYPLGRNDNQVGVVQATLAVEPLEDPSTGRREFASIDPVAFGSTREVSEATLVSDEVDGNAFCGEIPLAPTLETATILTDHDCMTTKQEHCSVDHERDKVGQERPDEYVNFLTERERDPTSEFDYLQRRDREYHRNIASSIGAAADRELADALAAQELERIPSNPTIVSNMPTRPVSAPRNETIPSRATPTAREPTSPLVQPQAFPLRRSNSADNLAVVSAIPRTLLPWSVVQNPASGLWIATLQTNQKALENNEVEVASRSLRIFSMQTKKQAISLARAWTPPKMLPTRTRTKCHICQSKFGPFRRACHCRNCGVVVCLKDCANQWPAKMIPETYNIKKEFYPNVCKSCNWLCNAFRKALMEGDRDKAMAVYSTGNVNLYTPFANVKGELFYPVHCAVLGDSLDLLRFLVDDHCCPIKSARGTNSGRSSQPYTPIVTSKGRSLLGMAMTHENLEIARYLVIEKGVDIATEPGVTMELLCRNFLKVLHFLPSYLVPTEDSAAAGAAAPQLESSGPSTAVATPPIAKEDPRRTISEEARDFGAVAMKTEARNDEECIICFDNPIDCVCSPCMHQICCIRCSKNLNGRCPVCSSECSFLRVFRP